MRAVLDPLLGPSTVAVRLSAAIERVASTPRTTVLLVGERGSGKAELARAIHARSDAAGEPFVEVRATEHGEAELAAVLARARSAGTVAIGRVERLSSERQGQLLALLESDEPRARIVVAADEDLEDAASEGRFREDLLYRVNVLRVAVPPLRERPEDVPSLAAAGLERLCRAAGIPCPALSADVLEALSARDWPGNLRELALELERACLVAPDDIVEALQRGSIPAEGLGGPAVPAGRDLRAVEAAWIRRVLDECGGNRSRTARELGIHRGTLYEKLRRYSIE